MAALDKKKAELGEIDEQLQRFARGVSGVPYFILSDGKRRIRMSGAQPPAVFDQIFAQQIAAK